MAYGFSTCSVRLCKLSGGQRGIFFSPVATIFGVPSGNGRWSALASSQGARSQTSYSSVVVGITGIAFGWTPSTSAFGLQVRKA
jgi:hypothetical protein